MRNRRLLAPALLLLAAVTGCPPEQHPPMPAQPVQSLTRDAAIAKVNANNSRIGPAIRCRSVAADIRIKDDSGQRRQFMLEGPLVFLKPRSLYFDLRQFGSTAVRVGSNDTEYWLWIKPERDTLWWGEYDRLTRLPPSAIPIRPDRLIEALGLSDLPATSDIFGSPMYRVTDEWNQVIFFAMDLTGQAVIEREYYLDRRPPFLARMIVFRNREGREVMIAHLDDYQPATNDGTVQMPGRIRVQWPLQESSMDMRVHRWENNVSIAPDAAAFRRPTGARHNERVDENVRSARAND